MPDKQPTAFFEWLNGLANVYVLILVAFAVVFSVKATLEMGRTLADLKESGAVSASLYKYESRIEGSSSSFDCIVVTDRNDPTDIFWVGQNTSDARGIDDFPSACRDSAHAAVGYLDSHAQRLLANPSDDGAVVLADSGPPYFSYGLLLLFGLICWSAINISLLLLTGNLQLSGSASLAATALIVVSWGWVIHAQHHKVNQIVGPVIFFYQEPQQIGISRIDPSVITSGVWDGGCFYEASDYAFLRLVTPNWEGKCKVSPSG